MTVKMVQRMWLEQEVPSKLSRANICLLPKDPIRLDDPACYRPISLMNAWLKIVDKMIAERL